MLKSMIVSGCVSLCLILSPSIVQAQATQLQGSPNASSQGGSGQNQLSPLEINQFSQAIKQLQAIEIKNQQKMLAAIKDAGLSPERYMEIEKSARDRSYKPETPITPDEEEKFIKVATKLQEIWQEAQPKREKAVTTQGLTIERFAQINDIVAKDPALQKQVQQIVGR